MNTEERFEDDTEMAFKMKAKRVNIFCLAQHMTENWLKIKKDRKKQNGPVSITKRISGGKFKGGNHNKEQLSRR